MFVNNTHIRRIREKNIKVVSWVEAVVAKEGFEGRGRVGPRVHTISPKIAVVQLHQQRPAAARGRLGERERVQRSGGIVGNRGDQCRWGGPGNAAALFII